MVLLVTLSVANEKNSLMLFLQCVFLEGSGQFPASSADIPHIYGILFYNLTK